MNIRRPFCVASSRGAPSLLAFPHTPRSSLRRGALSHSVHNAEELSLTRSTMPCSPHTDMDSLHGTSAQLPVPPSPLSFATPWPLALSAPPHFWACLSSLRQSGADTPPSLVNVTGGFPHPAKPLPFVSPVADYREPFFLLFPLGFGGNSRRSRAIALSAREFRAGNLAASPSIPRGMSPHGARLLWVVVGKVAL